MFVQRLPTFNGSPEEEFPAGDGAERVAKSVKWRSVRRRHLVAIRPIALIWFGLLGLWLAGCDDGSADRILMRKACLEHIYEGYVAYLMTHDQGPSGVEQFSEFLAAKPKEDASGNPLASANTVIGGQSVADEAVARLREVEIVVIWGGSMPTDQAELANRLVAFEARVPGSGGYIVPADGLVRHVSATDFSDYRELPTDRAAR